MNRSTIRIIMYLIVLLAASPLSGFTDTESGQQKILTAERPLYLAEHLDAARIEGSKVPKGVPEPVEWRFDEPQPDWKPLKPIPAEVEAVKPVRVEDALRLPLTVKNRDTKKLHMLRPAEHIGIAARSRAKPRLFGAIYVELPDWDINDWAYVEIRARTRDPMAFIALNFNYTNEDPYDALFPTYSRGDASRSVTDGTI